MNIEYIQFYTCPKTFKIRFLSKAWIISLLILQLKSLCVQYLSNMMKLQLLFHSGFCGDLNNRISRSMFNTYFFPLLISEGRRLTSLYYKLLLQFQWFVFIVNTTSLWFCCRLKVIPICVCLSRTLNSKVKFTTIWGH